MTQSAKNFGGTRGSLNHIFGDDLLLFILVIPEDFIKNQYSID